MLTTVRINGIDYDGVARADASLRIDEWTISLEGIDEVSFTVQGCGPIPFFSNQQEVRLSTTDASVTTLRFVGDIDHVQQQLGQYAWEFHIRATGLKKRADHITLTAPDGSGTAFFNRIPGDGLYVESEAGRTVGFMLTQILQGTANAAKLSAVGIGAYVTLTPPTLPAATVADLALLNVVPRRPAIFSGEGILNQIEQEITRYHPQFVLLVQPDGTIRLLNIFALPTHTITLPTEFDEGDPADGFSISRDTEGCFTAFEIIGLEVAPAVLSVVDGTLAAGWTMPQQTAWHYTDFTQPKDAYDEGVIIALTSTSATLDPADNTFVKTTNEWSNRIGWINLLNPVATGIQLSETRRVIANTVLTAGGTYTVSWDTSLPLDATGYTKYRLVGTAGALNDVWRLYYPREPATGAIGLDTWIGSHLYPALARPFSWANNDLGSATPVTSAAATVLWTSTGSRPYFSWPMTAQIVPELGAIRFTEPAVKPTTPLSFLNTTGSPTTFAQGLPWDIQVVVPYVRGNLFARVPATGWQGTAFTEDGLERLKEIHVDDWMTAEDGGDWRLLAAQHLDTLMDAVLQGTLSHHELPTSFDALSIGYALNIDIPGPSGNLRHYVNLPVRSITIRYETPSDLHNITWQFSNRKRMYQGDDLYTHPSFMNRLATEIGGRPGSNGWGDAGNYAPTTTNPMGHMVKAPGSNAEMMVNDFQQGANPMPLGPAGNLTAPDMSQFNMGSMDVGAGSSGGKSAGKLTATAKANDASDAGRAQRVADQTMLNKMNASSDFKIQQSGTPEQKIDMATPGASSPGPMIAPQGGAEARSEPGYVPTSLGSGNPSTADAMPSPAPNFTSSAYDASAGPTPRQGAAPPGRLSQRRGRTRPDGSEDAGG